MLMLLSVHETSVLFLVRFNNFALLRFLLELHALTLVTRSYALLAGDTPHYRKTTPPKIRIRRAEKSFRSGTIRLPIVPYSRKLLGDFNLANWRILY